MTILSVLMLLTIYLTTIYLYIYLSSMMDNGDKEEESGDYTDSADAPDYLSHFYLSIYLV